MAEDSTYRSSGSRFVDRAGRCILVGILILTFAIVGLTGCDEKDVPFVVDEDELLRYIAEDEVARELFSNAGIIDTTAYSMPFDAAVYRDSLLAHEREYTVSYLAAQPESLWADYGALGRLREGAVAVLDLFTVQTRRDFGDSVLVDTTVRSVERYAFFLKLGDDAQDYVGWLLWGFNGIGQYLPQAVTRVKLFDGSDFSGDLSLYLDNAQRLFLPGIPGGIPHLQLSEMTAVPAGSRLVLLLSESSSQPDPSVYMTSGLDSLGVFRHSLPRSDTLSTDTLRARRAAPPHYNLIFVHEFDDDQFDYRGTWCIPYRL